MTRFAVPSSGPSASPDEREARFHGLYESNFAAVLGYALRRTAQRADAADVVAETFLVAWRRFDAAPPGDGRPWLFGIARHVLANHHRAGRRRDRLGGRLRATLSAGDAQTAPDPAVGVAESDRVRRALGRIGPDDRELLMLVGWDGLTPTEAAAVLDIKPGTARMRLARARTRMRELLGESDDGSGTTGDAEVAPGHVQGVPTLHATGKPQ